MSLRASIVVPTYKRPDFLDRCLAALKAQDLEPAQYEIIIADDAASDLTRRQVETWSRLGRPPSPATRYVPVAGVHGPAAARNAGWRQARGEVLAFTDDDCVPEPDWLRRGLAAFTGDVAAAWGSIHVPLPAAPTDYEKNEAGLQTAEFATANCFCRRDILAQVGGFDERFRMAWREDADLFFTLLERGLRVVHVPEARVRHPVRPGHWGISLGQQRKSQFNALLYKKHPALYRERIQPGPPWRYYAAIGGAAAALAGVVGDSTPLALTGAAAWLGLTLRFCAHRLRRTSRAPAHVAEMVLTSALIPPLSVFWRLRGALRFRVLFL